MKPQLMIPLALLSMMGVQAKAIAHGVEIGYQMTEAIEINAVYDTGDPMTDAQVIVYAPSDPSTPWMTGTTDEQGRFVFTPDRSQIGNWDIAVRQAGHGEILSIPVDGKPASDVEQSPSSASDTVEASNRVAAVNGASSNGLNSMTPLQKGIMGASVIWGFIGTALFFARGKK